MTKAEACLWKYVLKSRNDARLYFQKAETCNEFIADFMCIPLKLVIEVNGITHLQDDVKRKDEIKKLLSKLPVTLFYHLMMRMYSGI